MLKLEKMKSGWKIMLAHRIKIFLGYTLKVLISFMRVVLALASSFKIVLGVVMFACIVGFTLFIVNHEYYKAFILSLVVFICSVGPAFMFEKIDYFSHWLILTGYRDLSYHDSRYTQKFERYQKYLQRNEG